MKYLSLILFFISFVASGQKNEADTTSSKQLEEVEVKAFKKQNEATELLDKFELMSYTIYNYAMEKEFDNNEE